MMTRLEKPIFMTAEEMNRKYDGKYLLVKQIDRKKVFKEGEVIAWGEDTEEDFNCMAYVLGTEFPNCGFLHPAHIDRGDDLHVTFCGAGHSDIAQIYL